MGFRRRDLPGLTLRPDPFARRAQLTLAICFTATLVAGLLSEGVYHEDDLKHFLYARWSQHCPSYLLEDWGRPGFTVPFALPTLIGDAQTGLHAARIWASLMTAATAWLAYLIGRQMRLRHAWLAVVFVYAQPLMTRLSFTTLTETPLALYFALATWLLIRQRPTASAAIMALAPITRHEAIVLLPLWAIALWRIRANVFAYPLLLWALALHNGLNYLVFDEVPFMRFLTPSAAEEYGSGTLLTYVPRLLHAAGPIVAALAILGMRRLWRRRSGWLIVAAAAAYFAAETLIYMRGAYSSGGYARFLVPMAPWLAGLAVGGLQPIFVRRRARIFIRTIVAVGGVMIALWVLCEIEWRIRPPILDEKWHGVALTGRIAAAIVCAVLAVALYRFRGVLHAERRPISQFAVVTLGTLLFALPAMSSLIPMRLNNYQRLMRDVIPELRRFGWDDRPLIVINYWLYYWSGRWTPPVTEPWYQQIAKARKGTLFVWDERFCTGQEFDFPLTTMRNDPEWKLIWMSEPLAASRQPFLWLFEKTASPSSIPSTHEVTLSVRQTDDINAG